MREMAGEVTLPRGSELGKLLVYSLLQDQRAWRGHVGVNRLACILMAGLLGGACSARESLTGASPAEPAPLCRAESLACFDSAAVLTVDGASISARAWSEDLPTPGYLNRWHYLLDPSAEQLLAPLRGSQRRATIEVVARDDGSMLTVAHGRWELLMRPKRSDIAAQIAGQGGAREIREQIFMVARRGEWVELLIEEPLP